LSADTERLRAEVAKLLPDATAVQPLRQLVADERAARTSAEAALAAMRATQAALDAELQRLRSDLATAQAEAARERDARVVSQQAVLRESARYASCTGYW
jgi:hypothetical protein